MWYRPFPPLLALTICCAVGAAALPHVLSVLSLHHPRPATARGIGISAVPQGHREGAIREGHHPAAAERLAAGAEQRAVLRPQQGHAGEFETNISM